MSVYVSSFANTLSVPSSKYFAITVPGISTKAVSESSLESSSSVLVNLIVPTTLFVKESSAISKSLYTTEISFAISITLAPFV